MTLAGNSPFGGGVIVAAGATLQFGDGENAGSLGGNIRDSGTVNFDKPASTYAGQIVGAGALRVVGGQQTLTGASTYSGLTAIDAGATLQYGDGVHSVSLKGAMVDNGTVIFHNSSATYSGAISGAGAGVLTLSGSSFYSGATTVNSGVLASSGGALAGDATVNAPGRLSILSAASLGSLAGGGVVLANPAPLTVGGDNSSSAFSGVISGAGALVKTGTGALTLSNANTFSGGATIASGIVNVGDDSALGSGAATMTGGALRAVGGISAIANSFTLSGTVGLGANTVLSGAITLAGDVSYDPRWMRAAGRSRTR